MLLVGSHNLTLSGYTYNREITSRLDDGPSVRAAWAFARIWAQRSRLPASDVAALFEAAEALVPALKPVASDPPETLIVGNTPDGPPLWSLLRKRLPHAVKEVRFVAPYVDPALALLRCVQRELAPERMHVALDPSLGAAPAQARDWMPEVSFVHAQGLRPVAGGGGAPGPVHAKILWFRDLQGGDWLVAGSANPTAAAFLADAQGRSAEAVVLRTPSTAVPSPRDSA